MNIWQSVSEAGIQSVVSSKADPLNEWLIIQQFVQWVRFSQDEQLDLNHIMQRPLLLKIKVPESMQINEERLWLPECRRTDVRPLGRMSKRHTPFV